MRPLTEFESGELERRKAQFEAQFEAIFEELMPVLVDFVERLNLPEPPAVAVVVETARG